MKKGFKFLTLVLCTALFLSACAGNTASNGGSQSGDGEGVSGALQALRDRGYVEVGFANEAPYAYEEDGELKGAAVEIAKAVFSELGIDEVRGQLSQWDQLVPGVQAGRFDAITAGMAIIPDRCPNVAFSEPTVKYGEGLVVAAGNPHNLHSYEDIANSDVTVAVMSGATEYQFLLDSGVSEDQIERVADIAATLDMVRTGRADATTATEMTVKKAVMDSEDNSLEVVEDFIQPDIDGVPSYGGTAFSNDNTELRDAYNEKLKELRDNGTIASILDDDERLPLWSSAANLPEDGVTTEQLCNR